MEQERYGITPVRKGRRYPFPVLIICVIGFTMSAIFIVLSFPQLQPLSSETMVSTPGSVIVLATGTIAPNNGSATTFRPISTPAYSFGDTLQAGETAPDFTLRKLDGGEVTLSSYQGQPVLINFWATWCAPCRLEMPELVRAYETYKEEGFTILAVNLTFQDSIEDVPDFVEEFEMRFPVLLDETGEVTDNLYHLLGLPMSVFVDREGTISRVHFGAMIGEQIDQFVGEIL